MKKLFKKCLYADYVHTAEGGDYAITVEGDTLYLFFEGSDGVEDWINNFDFPAKPYKRMEDVWFCHRGFLKVWKAMRDEIEEKVAQILREYEIITIKCVGYSHGAAIALLATEDMAYRHSFLYGGGVYTVEGYGFGAPRVLWGYVPKAVRERLSCFTVIRNVRDIVTHVPPALFGFHHQGRVLRVGGWRYYTPIKAHYPESYIAELTRKESIECKADPVDGRNKICKERYTL